MASPASASWSRNCRCIWLGAGLPDSVSIREIPHHSTVSKNRHGRFQESNLFQQLFEEIVDRCMEAGFVEGEHLSVDGSFIPANASRLSRIPREQLPEAAHVKRTVREYLADLEQENPIEEPTHQQDQISTTDPY